MWLAVLGVDSRWDNSVGLALPVRHFTEVIDDDVASFTDGIGTDDSLDGNHFANVRSGRFESLKRDVGLVKVRVGLQEILFATGTSYGGSGGRLGGRDDLGCRSTNEQKKNNKQD